jgi:branched-chain amino acid transport system permease protein
MVSTPAKGSGRRLFSWFPYLGLFLAFLIFIALLTRIENQYLARLVALIAFWAALATTWNWIGGYAGQLSLGHAAFVGLGAYLGYVLDSQFGITPWYALLMAVPLGALAACAIGAPTLRLTGVFFSLATVVFPITLQIVFTYWGYQEVLIPPRPDHPFLYMQWPDSRAYAALFGAFLLLYSLGTVALTRSRWRYYLAAVRQDQIAAASIGINTWVVKLIAFVASGSAACVLGVVYAQMLFVVSPETVLGINVSLQAMVLCLVGGVGRSYGPILGTLIVVPMTQALEANFAAYPGVPQLVYGTMLILVILLIPDGILARLQALPWGASSARKRRPERAWIAKAPGRSLAIVDPINVPVLREPQSILEVDGVSKRYGGVVAVSDVGFSVQRGEFVGIVGPNGAGKTTLFDLLTGFQRPSVGAIRFAAASITAIAPHQLARMGLRRTFQIPRPFAKLTVYENVLVSALVLSKRIETTLDHAVTAALDTIDLREREHIIAGELNPAQIRRLEVARAIVVRPEILLLDEPLAGLDPAETQELLELLKKLHSSGLTIIMVDHAIGVIAKAVERMVALNNGVLIADGAPTEVTQLPRVIDSYLGTRWQDA